MDLSNAYVNSALSFLLLWGAFIPIGPLSFILASQTDTGPGIDATITILYDNNPFDPRLMTGWGFSCLVQGTERSILFDTGGDGSILLHNMRHLAVEPAGIDVIVLSHIHGDHTGGLGSVLAEKRDVVAWVPVSFPGRFKKALLSLGVGIEEVSKAREIMAGVYTTGELGREIREQALVLKTVDGLVVITGCAHPGVVDVVRQAKAVTGEDTVYLVLGGFHLVGQPTSRIRSILRDLRRLSVRKVAPCHCSGDEARKLFKQEYGADYMECGVGRRITLRIR